MSDTTIGQLLRDAALSISENGVSDTPSLDAEVLLATALGISRSRLISDSAAVITSDKFFEINRLLEQRCAGIPLAYLLGTKEFWSLDFKVSNQVLIPRPETELLVELAIEKIGDGCDRIVDLGTGCGAIAIAIASETPHCDIFAVDQSVNALKVAEENANAIGVANIVFLESDWYSNLGGEVFELIVANPPYVDAKDPHLHAELRYEPQSALVSSDAGRADLNHIIRLAPTHLRAGGWLLVEHGYNQAPWVRQRLSDCGFSDITTLRDLGGNDRVSQGRSGIR